MTVHELVALLDDVLEDTEVIVEYDAGCALGQIMGIKTGDEGRVVLVIE